MTKAEIENTITLFQLRGKAELAKINRAQEVIEKAEEALRMIDESIRTMEALIEDELYD